MKKLTSLILILCLFISSVFTGEAEAGKLKKIATVATVASLASAGSHSLAVNTQRAVQTSYQVYIKYNRVLNEIYIGRTSGVHGAFKNIKNRDLIHHKHGKDGWDKAEEVLTLKSKEAVRYAEQFYIEEARRMGILTKQLNGISPFNPKKEIYRKAFAREMQNPPVLKDVLEKYNYLESLAPKIKKGDI